MSRQDFQVENFSPDNQENHSDGTMIFNWLMLLWFLNWYKKLIYLEISCWSKSSVICFLLSQKTDRMKMWYSLNELECKIWMTFRILLLSSSPSSSSLELEQSLNSHSDWNSGIGMFEIWVDRVGVGCLTFFFLAFLSTSSFSSFSYYLGR